MPCGHATLTWYGYTACGGTHYGCTHYGGTHYGGTHYGCTHYGRHAQRAQGLRLQDAASALRASLSSERCARGERRREARALELRELSVARVASAQVPFYG